MKKNKGFSLMELMVVVGIIGIFSAIAIPNFKKYKEKAEKQRSMRQKNTPQVRSANEKDTTIPVTSCLEGYKFIQLNLTITQVLNDKGQGIKCDY